MAAANPLMANRVFDEATLLQAAAILQQQQHQQNLVAQATLLAMQQGGTPDRSMSQVPLISLAKSAAAAAQHSDSAASSSQPREPGRVQVPEGSASAAAPSGAPNGAPRNLKQERTAQNFLRGCARLRMIQVHPTCLLAATLHARAARVLHCAHIHFSVQPYIITLLFMMQNNADRRRQRRACCLRARAGGRTSPGA